ncbi:MAG TPA: hypothetical protein VFZ16_14240 [Hyphomicrobiaceae bacterium]|jgi:hypothetical protein|nr:hypothetical protein [Hyphomicrobiaceae bacterium]
MRSVFRAWPSRLLATVMALALLASYSIGAYAHATGHHASGHRMDRHRLAQAVQATSTDGQADRALQHYASARDTAAEPQAGQMGGADGNKPGQALDCCDTICHGGQAVLAAGAVVLRPPLSLPAIEAAAAFYGASPGGLDRPPKAFVPA